MYYTKNTPVVEGWYWCRHEGDDEPFIYKVIYKNLDELMVVRDCLMSSITEHQFDNADWAGPIDKPVEHREVPSFGNGMLPQ